MDAVSVIALGLSTAAVVISTRLALRQNSIQRHSNAVPALSRLMEEFRSERFHESYLYVCNDLKQHSSEDGITGLPVDARRHVYAVCYLFQHFGELARLDVVDERELLAMLRARVVQVWGAVQPFVVSERQMASGPGPDVLRLLEAFAVRAQMIPVDSYARDMQRWLARPIRQHPVWTDSTTKRR